MADEELLSQKNAWNTCRALLSYQGFTVADRSFADLEREPDGRVSTAALQLYGLDYERGRIKIIFFRKHVAYNEANEIIGALAAARKDAEKDADTTIKAFASIVYSGKLLKLAEIAFAEHNKANAAEGDGQCIQIFMRAEIEVDITAHYLVASHKILSSEEKACVLARYRLREHEVPGIQHTDPMVKFINAVPGMMVKIRRRSQTAGVYVSYRVVRII